MKAPKTVTIGGDSIAERDARREAKLNKKAGIDTMSKEKQEEKRLLRIKFHNPVIKRDGGECVYCSLFFDRSRPAKHGDHMLTQKQWPELRFELWVGAGTCPECNERRNYGQIQTCIIRTEAGRIQCARYKVSNQAFGVWQGRLLAPSADGWKGYGDHVGEWKEIPAAEAERLELRNNVLI